METLECDWRYSHAQERFPAPMSFHPQGWDFAGNLLRPSPCVAHGHGKCGNQDFQGTKESNAHWNSRFKHHSCSENPTTKQHMAKPQLHTTTEKVFKRSYPLVFEPIFQDSHCKPFSITSAILANSSCQMDQKHIEHRRTPSLSLGLHWILSIRTNMDTCTQITLMWKFESGRT